MQTHLTHLEDMVVMGGKSGFDDAITYLIRVAETFRHPNVPLCDIQLKFDGSPSVFFGKYSYQDKPFVATKSPFAKTPKLFQSDDELDNHFDPESKHETDLKIKLSTLLKYVQESDWPDDEFGLVFNADMLFCKLEGFTPTSFKPNTIEYRYNPKSIIGKQIAEAVIGLHVHSYHDDFRNVRYKNKFRHGFFKEVFITPSVSVPHFTTFDSFKQEKFFHHLARAIMFWRNIHDVPFTTDNSAAIKKYINHCIREKLPISTYVEKYKQIFDYADINILFSCLLELIEAKTILLSSINYDLFGFETTFDGKPCPHEGIVVIIDGKPIKFVDRTVFSYNNFLTQQRAKK